MLNFVEGRSSARAAGIAASTTPPGGQQRVPVSCTRSERAYGERLPNGDFSEAACNRQTFEQTTAPVPGLGSTDDRRFDDGFGRGPR